MAAIDSEKSVDWPAAILDSQCRWTLGESLIHSQSDNRKSLNLDIEGLVSNKMHRLCRRDLEGALSFYSCYCDERTQYEHIRRHSKSCDNMENGRQWKRHNRRVDERLLSGWGLETWNVSTLSAARIINLARAGQNKHWSPRRICSPYISRESLEYGDRQ